MSFSEFGKGQLLQFCGLFGVGLEKAVVGDPENMAVQLLLEKRFTREE